MQLSGLQKQLEEAREFEPQVKSLQEKLQTVSKRSLEALTKAQNDREQLQQRLQAEAAETVKLRQQQQAVLAAVQGTGGSTNGAMHAAGGSLAVSDRAGAGSSGEAGAGPPEQVQGQRQAAWALQQALPQLQEVAGLKPALEALVKQHTAGESCLTSGVHHLVLEYLAGIPYLLICLVADVSCQLYLFLCGLAHAQECQLS